MHAQTLRDLCQISVTLTLQSARNMQSNEPSGRTLQSNAAMCSKCVNSQKRRKNTAFGWTFGILF